ncbi:MAG: hypothetical protein ABI045_00680 [Flavobacteriales bacterium]
MLPAPVKGTLFFNEATERLCYVTNKIGIVCFLDGIKQLVVDGNYKLCFRLKSNTLPLRGDNTHNQLGRAVDADHPAEIPEKIGFTKVVKISSITAGTNFIYILDSEDILHYLSISD